MIANKRKNKKPRCSNKDCRNSMFLHGLCYSCYQYVKTGVKIKEEPKIRGISVKCWNIMKLTDAEIRIKKGVATQEDMELFVEQSLKEKAELNREMNSKQSL